MKKSYIILPLSAFLSIAAHAGENQSWESLGKGRMTDFVITAFSYKPATFEVDIEKSTVEDGVYRICNPYANFVNPDKDVFTYNAADATPMVIHVVEGKYFYFDDFQTGYTHAEYGPLMAMCEAAHHIEIGIQPSTIIQYMNGCFGDFDGSTFTYGAKYIFEDMDSYTLSMGTMFYDFPCNIDGEFLLSLPGAKDYRCAVSVASSCGNGNKFSFSVDAGADAVVKYAILKGVIRESDERLVEFLQKGTDFGRSSGFVDVDCNGYEDGMYTFAAASFDGDGKLKRCDAVYFDVYNNNASDWSDIGEAKYTDDIMSSAYPSVPSVTYELDIEKHNSVPGYYRIVDPYGAKYPYNSYNRHRADSHSHYLLVCAADPERVYIEESSLGAEVSYGLMHVSSLAFKAIKEGKTQEEIDAMGVWGTLDAAGGEISFPANAIEITEFSNKGKWYPSNKSAAFKIVLPDVSGVSDVSVSEDMQARYYNLQGVPVDKPQRGVFVIRCRGGKAEKIIAE